MSSAVGKVQIALAILLLGALALSMISLNMPWYKAENKDVERQYSLDEYLYINKTSGFEKTYPYQDDFEKEKKLSENGSNIIYLSVATMVLGLLTSVLFTLMGLKKIKGKWPGYVVVLPFFTSIVTLALSIVFVGDILAILLNSPGTTSTWMPGLGLSVASFVIIAIVTLVTIAIGYYSGK